MSSLWILGCVASIIGSVFSNLGVNIQKHAALENAKLSESTRVHHCFQPIWITGFVLVIIGALADFGALSLAAQSIVAPIGSFTLVANIGFASCWLGEQLGWKDVLGTGMVIVGSVLSVAFGNHDDTSYTMEQIKEYWALPAFLGFLGVVAFLLLVCYFVSKYLEPMRDDLLLAYVAYDEANEVGDKQKLAEYKETVAQISAGYAPFQRIHPLSYCCISGFMGGISVLMAKIVSCLLKTTITGNDQFTSPFTYLFLVLMIFTIVIQTNYLAFALKYFDGMLSFVYWL